MIAKQKMNDNDKEFCKMMVLLDKNGNYAQSYFPHSMSSFI